MCQDYEGRVGELEYKTLRYPGHGAVFAALRELGFFDTEPRTDSGTSPRGMLLDLLYENLPSGEPDVVLVRVEVTAGSQTLTMEVEDVDDGRHSALARTTAFPATALCDLVVRGKMPLRGAAAMSTAAPAGPLMQEIAQVGITAVRR
jgi:saccharopine dehydrogenase-like NADP-dependent oxidoreductase